METEENYITREWLEQFSRVWIESVASEYQYMPEWMGVDSNGF